MWFLGGFMERTEGSQGPLATFEKIWKIKVDRTHTE